MTVGPAVERWLKEGGKNVPSLLIEPFLLHTLRTVIVIDAQYMLTAINRSSTGTTAGKGDHDASFLLIPFPHSPYYYR